MDDDLSGGLRGEWRVLRCCELGDVVVQQGAENIMRNVAKRILMGEVFQLVLSWKLKYAEAMRQEKAERMLKRVGARLRQRDAVEALVVWHDSAMTAKMQAEALRMQERGESILKRVGGRLRMGEAASNVAEWRRNTRLGVLEMVSMCVMEG